MAAMRTLRANGDAGENVSFISVFLEISEAKENGSGACAGAGEII